MAEHVAEQNRKFAMRRAVFELKMARMREEQELKAEQVLA